MDESRQNAKLLPTLCICAAAAAVLLFGIKTHRRSLERIAKEKAWDAYLVSFAEEGTALDAEGHRSIDAAMANVQNVGLSERYMLNGNFAEALNILDKIESGRYEKKNAMQSYCEAVVDFDEDRCWDALSIIEKINADALPRGLVSGYEEFAAEVGAACERITNAQTRPYVGMSEEDISSTDLGAAHLVSDYETYEGVKKRRDRFYTFQLDKTRRLYVFCLGGVVTRVCEYDTEGWRPKREGAEKSGIAHSYPFVGMSEEYISSTKWGDAVYCGAEIVNDTDGEHISRSYLFYLNGSSGDACNYHVVCVDGIVDGMTRFSVKNSSSSKHTTPSEPDAGKFHNAEDFYDYYYDDFFDYYDAENYYNEHSD